MLIYGLAIFTGSFLLFLIQPMTGKIILPALGGAPAVWTTCMLFFQAALFAGYLYADKAIKKLGCEKQSIIHLMLMILGFIALPLDIEFTNINQAAQQPVTWLFARLILSIGFHFFLIAANAPMLQRWYSQSGQKDSHDPYFLYSASNTGSLLALLAYPFLFEPFLNLTTHKMLWSAIYVLQVIFVFFAAYILWKKATIVSAHTRLEDKMQTNALRWKSIFKWVLWGFIPCSAMLAVTTHIATDIASGPMLWIFPLSIYLISFILVFTRNPRFRNICWDRQMLPMAAIIATMYIFGISRPVWFVMLLHLYFLFTVCMAFHSRLAIDRPVPALLNSFYIWMSIGGILGGIFNGIIAPNTFNTQLEYIVTITIAVISVTFAYATNNDHEFSFWQEAFVFIVICLVFLTFAEKLYSRRGFMATLFVLIIVHLFYRFRKAGGIIFILGIIVSLNFLSNNSKFIKITRSFFGIYKISRIIGVVRKPDPKIGGVRDIFYRLIHGTTLHGAERKVEVRPIFPLTYYSREGPVGDTFRTGLIKRRAKKVGIVGLGCGTIAWYGRSWQQFDFYEIDPTIVNIASNPKYFTYLSRSKAKIRIIVGDARVKLRQAPDHEYDMLILDAYSSDSIPVHLLTLEAFALYKSKIKPNGLIVLHISNRHFKLGPVVARILSQLQFHFLVKIDDPKNYSLKYDWYDETQLCKSTWVAASLDVNRVSQLKIFSGWRSMKINPAYSIWTDNYANLLQVYDWL